VVTIGHVRREVAVDPLSALLDIGAPHQAVDGRVGLLKQFVEQEGSQKTCRAGQEYVCRLIGVSDR
jgi:hypothetical protein